MKSTTIAATIASAIWLALVWLGASVIEGIAAQHAQGYPNWAQISIWVGFPALVAASLVFSIFYFNRVRKSALGLGTVAGLSLGVILPFVFTFAGGV